MARKRKHPGSLERRGDSFRVWLCIDGKRHRYTVPTKDRHVAALFAANKYGELERERGRRIAGLPDSISMTALLDLYEKQELPKLTPGTQSAYGDSLRPIRTFFVETGDPPVEKLRTANILDFLAWRRLHRLDGTKPLGNRTIGKDRAVLHRVFDFAEMRELREGNPVAKTEAPAVDEREPVILSTAEYEKLLEACGENDMLHMFVLILGETGMRCESEALHLQWHDISFETGFITVVSGREDHRTKNGKTRVVPMTPVLREGLKTHAAKYRMLTYSGKRSNFVIHHVRARRQAAAGTRIGTMRDAFNTAAATAGISEAFVQHDLRHRRVTTWLAEGKSPVAVMKAMGHADLKTTMGYYRFIPDHLRSLVDERENAASSGESRKSDIAHMRSLVDEYENAASSEESRNNEKAVS